MSRLALLLPLAAAVPWRLGQRSWEVCRVGQSLWTVGFGPMGLVLFYYLLVRRGEARRNLASPCGSHCEFSCQFPLDEGDVKLPEKGRSSKCHQLDAERCGRIKARLCAVVWRSLEMDGINLESSNLPLGAGGWAGCLNTTVGPTGSEFLIHKGDTHTHTQDWVSCRSYGWAGPTTGVFRRGLHGAWYATGLDTALPTYVSRKASLLILTFKTHGKCP